MASTAAEAEVVLRDGSTAHVRAITLEDQDRMRTFLGLLSEDSRRLRYFSGGADLDWAAGAAVAGGVVVRRLGDVRVASRSFHGPRPVVNADVPPWASS